MKVIVIISIISDLILGIAAIAGISYGVVYFNCKWLFLLYFIPLALCTGDAHIKAGSADKDNYGKGEDKND